MDPLAPGEHPDAGAEAARLQAIFEQAAVGIATSDLAGNYRDVNRRFCAMLGYGAEELRRMSFRDITHPEDVPRSAEEKRRLVAGETREYRREKRYVRRDGSLFWASTAVTVLRDGAGHPVELIGVIEDISDRKATEQALERSEAFSRGIVQASQDCIKTLALDGTLLWISEAGAQSLGIARPAEVIGRPLADFYQGNDREAARAALAAAARGESGSFVGQCHVRGEARWWSVVVTPICDAGGRPEKLLAVSRDITGAIRVEQQLRRESRLKDEFLATLSHELRTPLSAILGWAHLLRARSPNAQELARGLEVVERNARLQQRLVEDLLDMSRIGAGKLRLDVQQVHPATFIDAALETVRPAAEAKAIRVERELESVEPIAGDAARLQQVVWNLLSNAIKFTPRGGVVRVWVKVDAGYLEIGVADNGAGIAPEFLAHVFERFRQADASTTRGHGGLGLGLSIARQLVEMHGGRVLAESEGTSKGATFKVHLPLAGATRAPPATPQPAAQPAPEVLTFTRVDLRGRVALVVDDHGDALEIVAAVLTECGAEVVTASCARDALQWLSNARADILVSDIAMPEMDGYELLGRVRALPNQHGRDLPAIAMTAFARPEDRARALSAGFQAHVTKPLEPAALAATIAGILAAQRVPDAGKAEA